MRKKNYKKSIILSFYLVIFILNFTNIIFANSSNADIYIDDNFNSSTPGWGITHFNNIQAGLNAATVNSTIYVFIGTYYENIHINKSLNLIGENKEGTIIDGDNIGDVITISASYVNVSGFTIKNSGEFGTNGLIILNTSNNYIVGNNFFYNYYGINLQQDCIDNKIYHNNFIYNFFNAFDFSASENNEWDNGYPSGGNFWEDYTGTDQNQDGIGDESYHVFGSDNCKDKYPLMYNWPTSLKTVFVDTDNTVGPWDGTLQYPYQYIQDAINISSYGDTVYVFNGSYYENLFIDKFIQLIGENKNTTIIDGSSSEDVIEVYSYNTVISGFTIKNTGVYDARGVIIWDTGYNEITDNIFVENYMGISLKGNCFDNIIHHNYFINNLYNAYDYTECDNLWDDGSGGNYWDDYIGNDNDGDGIGDTPYFIEGPYDCYDRYPLMAIIETNSPPFTPSNPTPQNGATSININQDLSWSGGDPDDDDIVTYDVYFGTNNPPEKKIANQSATVYDPGTMSYNTKYYWKIVSWDNDDKYSVGTVWSFTTASQSSGGNGGGGSQPPIIPSNLKPVANASASDKTGYINTPINFDGSNSLDEDGDITNYTWDFDDGTFGYGEIISHTYSKVGSYNVKLTVTDDVGADDSDIFTVVIKSLNNPPSIPNVEGPIFGHQNINYNFNFYSTDPENDNIQYVINWDDDESTETGFVSSGTKLTEEHKWNNAGIYNIKIFAIDINYANSDSADYTILIDVWYVHNIGYLIDENSDDIYDAFYVNFTGFITDVIYENGNYLIDTDEDGKNNYKYNLEKDDLTKIDSIEKDKTSEIEDIMLYLLVFIIIIIILIVIVLGRRSKLEPQDKKEKIKEEEKLKDKTKTKKKKQESNKKKQSKNKTKK
jgi:parallel beta-helix repeat protein